MLRYRNYIIKLAFLSITAFLSYYKNRITSIIAFKKKKFYVIYNGGGLKNPTTLKK